MYCFWVLTDPVNLRLVRLTKPDLLGVRKSVELSLQDDIPSTCVFSGPLTNFKSKPKLSRPPSLVLRRKGRSRARYVYRHDHPSGTELTVRDYKNRLFVSLFPSEVLGPYPFSI